MGPAFDASLGYEFFGFGGPDAARGPRLARREAGAELHRADERVDRHHEPRRPGRPRHRRRAVASAPRSAAGLRGGWRHGRRGATSTATPPRATAEELDGSALGVAIDVPRRQRVARPVDEVERAARSAGHPGQQRRHRRDQAVRRLHRGRVGPHHRRQPQGPDQLQPAVLDAMIERRLRAHREHRLRRRPGGIVRRSRVLGDQGRGHRVHEDARPGGGAPRDHGQLRVPRADRDRAAGPGRRVQPEALRRASPERSRSDGPASPTTSPRRSRSWPATMRPTSPARPCRSAAD